MVKGPDWNKVKVSTGSDSPDSVSQCSADIDGSIGPTLGFCCQLSNWLSNALPMMFETYAVL